MSFSDDAPESVYREVRDMDALLREHEHHRRRLLREISAVQLWQRTHGTADVAYWVSKVTLQHRSRELETVEKKIARLKATMERIVTRFPTSAALLPDSRTRESTAAAVSTIFHLRPTPRRSVG